MPNRWIEFRATLPDGSATRERFEGRELLLGRSPLRGVALADPLLAPVHLRFLRGPEGWRAEDLAGGATLNGKPLDGTPLCPGDLLSLGATRIEVIALGNGGPPKATSRSDAEALRSTLRWYEERLEILNEVQQDLAGPVREEEVLALVLDMVFKHLGPEQASLFLFERGGGLRIANRQLREDVEPLELPVGLLGEASSWGPTAKVFAAAEVRGALEGASLAPGVRSVVVSPLVGPGGPTGLLALGSRSEPGRFSGQDLDLLASLASAAALRLHSLALAEEAAERQRLREEIALARRIQVALLPSSFPEVPGYETYGVNLPHEGVSGDYFMLLPRAGGGELVLWVADVCGKGIGASLLMASLEALAAAPIEEGHEPREVLSRVSKLLYERTPAEKYATATLAVLCPGTGVVRYASAGHNPALLVRAEGRVEWLGSTGLPIGLLVDRRYRQREFSLAGGDLLALYTDGITELRDPEGEEFGTERLAGVLRASRERPLPEVVAELERAMAAFARGVPYDDDRTLVLLRRRG
jgi:serine phosphatase RsbU (regulator of sigma subunit)